MEKPKDFDRHVKRFRKPGEKLATNEKPKSNIVKKGVLKFRFDKVDENVKSLEPKVNVSESSESSKNKLDLKNGSSGGMHSSVKSVKQFRGRSPSRKILKGTRRSSKRLLPLNPSFSTKTVSEMIQETFGDSKIVPSFQIITKDSTRIGDTKEKCKSTLTAATETLIGSKVVAQERIILGLTESLWTDIFEYLPIEDLKKFRLVSSETNSFAINSLVWAINTCFLFDEKCEPRLKKDAPMPTELLCSDETLGWPDVRLKNVQAPFSPKTFWPNHNVRYSILSIEIQDCLLTWKDILELLCLQNITKFSYILTVNFLSSNDVLTPLVENMSAFFATIEKTFRIRKLDTMRPNKKITIKALNLDVTNILFGILEALCHNEVEELRVILSEKLFLKSFHHITSYHPDTVLKARKIIEKNQLSLQVLQISFVGEMTGRVQTEIVDMFGIQTPSHRFFRHLYKEKYEKLNLRELIIEIPALVTFPSTSNMKNLNEWFKSSEEDIDTSGLFQFCHSQKNLERFKFSRVDCANIPDFSELSGYIKKPSNCLIEIGMKIFFTSTQENVISMWEKANDFLVDLCIFLGEETVPLNCMINEEMTIMSNTKRLEVLNEVKGLKYFAVPILTSKFPNLTCLTLGDLLIPTDGFSNSPKITDRDFQIIIEHLPKLVEIVLKCNLSELSDFGLTGISHSACKRMKMGNSFKRKPGDVVGLSISKLKYLEVLELHGLGVKVTNVTAYLAFKDLLRLEELYLYTPKFTRLSRKFLKHKFALRNIFSIVID